GNQKSKELFFNLLGRLCHLLTDMGVPEHVRRSMHLMEDSSPFEHWLKRSYDTKFYWTAEKVYNERGGFVNPFCELNGDKNLFLFYTLAQLSDWFVTYGCLPNDGNNNYDVNVGEIHSIIANYAPEVEFFQKLPSYVPKGPGLREQHARLTDAGGVKFRDMLLPYTIRAVAGMLYRFIIESKMQDRYATSNDMGSIYDQQQELNLFNQNIDGKYYTFRAEGNPGRITVCSETRPSGYSADFIIGQNARNVTFRAAKEIIFKPGFAALAGSQVRAYVVDGCSPTSQSGNCKQCLDEDYSPKY
ncbi:MAG: hypothetical protein Q8M94_09260, partial [Ignavibacteria bacterium]|nr:hypothetical protein [Ignavibacteria bacterium]